MKWNKPYLYIFSTLGFLIVCGLAILYSSLSNNEQEIKALSVIDGVQSGDVVAYKIRDGVHIISQGHDVITDQKSYKIKRNHFTARRLDLNYELEIKRANAPINIHFNMDENSQVKNVSINGLQKFSTIEYGRDNDAKQTKADWAGSLEIPSIKRTSNIDENFEIALFGNSLPQAIEEQNPLTIRIMETNGGGLRSDSNINFYSIGDDDENWYENLTLDITNAFGLFDGDDCRVDGGLSKPKFSYCLDSFTDHINNLKSNFVEPLMMMSNQLHAAMMDYVGIIGQFLDAKQQLESQQQIQIMTAQAHKDYHPSEQMCRFGSMVKTLAKAEEKTKLNKAGLNDIFMARVLDIKNSTSAVGKYADMKARLKQFKTTYCDPKDMNNGLATMCQYGTDVGGSNNKERLNKDIDYARTLSRPLTLNIDMMDTVLQDDEEDIIALAKNLYWPQTFSPVSSESLIENSTEYMAARRYKSMQAVAHNSFAKIASLKSKSPNSAFGGSNGGDYMHALLQEFGLSESAAKDLLGENPSYHAQMEVLTKKVYQSPDFYTNLIDKPSNIDRIGVSMDAFKLMQMRDWHETSLRKEMLNSLLIESALKKHIDHANNNLSNR